jgi:hypothetical protein
MLMTHNHHPISHAPATTNLTSKRTRRANYKLITPVLAIAILVLCGLAAGTTSADGHRWHHRWHQDDPPVSTPPSQPDPEPTPGDPVSAPPVTVPPQTSSYPLHAGITTTYFWVGEDASADNFGIPNTSTEWDEQAGAHFGGVDDPYARLADGLPAAFTPQQNPYYFALPASEFNNSGAIPGAHEASPWAAEAASLNDNQSLFKGRWAKITGPDGQMVYAQWIDTGPSNNGNQSTDYGYVFGDGSQMPTNKAGLAAGMDVSPTIAYRFGMIDSGQATVSWQFVDTSEVPDGPWTQFPAINNLTYWN